MALCLPMHTNGHGISIVYWCELALNGLPPVAYTGLPLIALMFLSATGSKSKVLLQLQIARVEAYLGLWTPCVTTLIGPALSHAPLYKDLFYLCAKNTNRVHLRLVCSLKGEPNTSEHLASGEEVMYVIIK